MGDYEVEENWGSEIVRSYEDCLRRLQTASRDGTANPEKTAELIKMAKGSKSMRKYAEELGVNVSTVSRILSGQVKEISIELLARIVSEAKPESGVTLEKMMLAQGMYHAVDMSLLQLQNKTARRVVVESLLKKGYTVRYLSEPRSGMSFVISTNAIKENGYWQLDVYHGNPITCDLEDDDLAFAINWLNHNMAKFYRKDTNITRFSLLFIDKTAAFDQMKQFIARYTIPDEISIILVSVAQGKVIEEYIITLRDGSAPKSVFK